MATRQGSSRSKSAKRSVSSSLPKKDDRNLSVRFAEPARTVRKVTNVSPSSRGHVVLPNKATRPKTCGPAVQHVPAIVVSEEFDNNNVRPSTSGNKIRRPSVARGGGANMSPFNAANRADTPTPDIVLKAEPSPGGVGDNRSEARRALRLPPMRARARSVPNVIHVSIPEDVPVVQEQKAAAAPPPPPPILQQNTLSPEGPRGSRSTQRRGSINISTERLLRDLAHGIQHAELQEEEPEPRWSSKQQSDWDNLKSCRYLRFSKRYENELEKEVDPFS